MWVRVRLKKRLFKKHCTRTRISDCKITKKSLFLATYLFWLGWLDSNQRMPVSKTGALPLGDSPILLGICIYILFFQNMQVFFKKIIIFIIFYKMYTEHINLFLCPLFVTNSYIFDITIHLTLFWISIFNLHLMMNTLGESVRDKSLVLVPRTASFFGVH